MWTRLADLALLVFKEDGKGFHHQAPKIYLVIFSGFDSYYSDDKDVDFITDEMNFQ